MSMRLITITGGQGTGKSRLAQQRYEEARRAGWSVAMIDTDSHGDFYTDEVAKTDPDVKIVVNLTEGPLKEVARQVA